MTGKARKKGSIFEVDVEIRDGIKSGIEVIHTRAKAILTDKFSQPPILDISAYLGSKAYFRSMDEVYDKILFHGVALRGIKEIISYSSKGMLARISSAPSPVKWMKEPLRSKWIGDPLVLDSAFQMAIIWCFEEMGVVSLPTYSASYRQYRNKFPSEGVTALLEVREVTKRKLKGDFTFLDKNNVVVAQLTGYEAAMDDSLFKAFKAKDAANA
jgi:Polyketide synthase dehydratase N-terminal domain